VHDGRGECVQACWTLSRRCVLPFKCVLYYRSRYYSFHSVCVDGLEVITLPFYMTSDNSCTYFGHFSMIHAWMSLFYSLLLDTYPSVLLVTGETSLEASCASHRCWLGGHIAMLWMAHRAGNMGRGSLVHVCYATLQYILGRIQYSPHQCYIHCSLSCSWASVC
jgi:hypothetical protein